MKARRLLTVLLLCLSACSSGLEQRPDAGAPARVDKAVDRREGREPSARASNVGNDRGGKTVVRGTRVARRGSPAGGGRFRFAVIGDFGSGSSDQYEIADRMCRWRKRKPFDLVVTTGDNVYDHGERSRFREVFFRPYACLFKEGVKFHSSLGNHDYETRRGRPELREPRFGMPARNYVVRRGGVRFVVANSNDLRMRWLSRASQAEAGDAWTVVVFHHPVYSSGAEHGSTPGYRPGLPRLFRRRGVDLVLNGHDHIYSVSKELRGIRYVVTGGGGAPLYGCTRRWFTDVCRSRYHFLYVSAGERIHAEAVPAKGRRFGGFSTDGRD